MFGKLFVFEMIGIFALTLILLRMQPNSHTTLVLSFSRSHRIERSHCICTICHVPQNTIINRLDALPIPTIRFHFGFSWGTTASCSRSGRRTAAPPPTIQNCLPATNLIKFSNCTCQPHSDKKSRWEKKSRDKFAYCKIFWQSLQRSRSPAE